MKPVYDSILRIGSQSLIPVGNHYRFVIEETMPHTGCKFKFSIRERIIQEMIKRGIRLEVRFAEHPDISFNFNPIQWKNLGEKKYEVKLFKNNPMPVFYYYVGFNNQLVNKPDTKQAEGQGAFI